MIVVHIESGLGNQMLSYCEYLAMKKCNPDKDIFIENLIYDIPECNDTICQWNGYELTRIFGLKPKNIKELFSDKEWVAIMKDIRLSRFWEKEWNYPVYITQALNSNGLNIDNVRGNFEKEECISKGKKGIIGEIRGYFTNRTWIGNHLRRIIANRRTFEEDNESIQKMLYMETERDIFTGQRLTFKFVGAGIEKIKDDIDNSFVFPQITDKRNLEFVSFIDSCNAVFIHARRGDMLSSNGWCYKYGYFKRAVKYIKQNVDNPIFIFFTNTGSIEWCKDNSRVFGLDYSKDIVYFVDWNVGENSFRDMQLMAHCKHGIITNSTFGWWGAYFIKNPNKITISPLAEINTTYHC